ncbi:MAG: Gfo/Idh/MocA family oxidoreductase [Burkholderiales bacterium]|jgi:predicted dehydrogenase|nr:Gfo/Idh/MocA family oxidoreductase [Burkholderiales bacterium]
MIKIGIVGVGKMGLSHLSIVNTHPGVRVVGVCDAAGYVLDVLSKYTGLAAYADYRELVERAKPDALIVATPTRTHAEIVRHALQRGLHVFVEKPFCLSVDEGCELAALAARAGVVNQVGYHYRFVGAFQEAKRLIEKRAIGEVHNFRVEAYGPVVLQPKGSTWRSNKTEGGGCLYDYASHAANLVTHLFGMPAGVGGAAMQSVFSKGVDDEVYATLYYANGLTGQLCINWSDDTQRKMSMRVEAWGREGKLNADRQECQLYLRGQGWDVRYTTELTAPVRYYVRGEEFSAQMDYFVECIGKQRPDNLNSFASALEADLLLDMIERDAALGPRTTATGPREFAPGKSNIRQALGRWIAGKPALQRVS